MIPIKEYFAMDTKSITNKLKEKGLRITPQRIAIFEAIIKLDNHPTADNVIEYIKKKYANISTGTVYKVLDSFIENNLLKKVKTENGVMRYDPFLTNHHHLYCTEANRIEDYEDSELDELITNYFKNKKIKNFKIQDINLQITGTYNN
jgi:Fur family peroxide stress response transcriptional regulator